MFEVIISYFRKKNQVIITDDPNQYLIKGEERKDVRSISIRKIKKGE